MSYKIKYINLQAQHNSIKKEIRNKIESIFSKSAFILRKEVSDFEKKITKMLKVKYCVALNSGTDALLMALSQLKIKKGDEILVPSHTYVASVGAIKHVGAEPVFVDIRNDFNLDPKEIINKITKKTKAIMVVHLNGRSCEMDTIMKLAKKYKLEVIEDAAQAFGSKFNNKCVNVNVSVNLENVYNRNIKVANIDIDKRCPKCEGSGVIFVDNGVKKCKNSKSKVCGYESYK